MTIIVGYATDERGGAALNLGVMLARSSDDDLVVACVVPAPWVPGMARIDSEYRSALDEIADRALDQARTSLPAGVSAGFVRHSARSGAGSDSWWWTARTTWTGSRQPSRAVPRRTSS